MAEMGKQSATRCWLCTLFFSPHVAHGHGTCVNGRISNKLLCQDVVTRLDCPKKSKGEGGRGEKLGEGAGVCVCVQII